MTDSFYWFDVFTLCGGLALFLYGMNQGEKNIRRVGGVQLKKIIGAISRHRIFSYLTGLTVTLITQSSSATTVILVGLTNARLMTLGQSLGMILGSDLGTTITVQLFAFKFHQLSPLLITIGYFLSLKKKSERLSNYGKLVLAAGLIFYGMSVMAEAVKPLRTLPLFENALHSSFSNPWYGLLAGTVITAIIQSSAATLTIVIALLQSMQGAVPTADHLFPIVIGANLGTCATAFLSTMGGDISGARVAWSHFLFKLFGCTLFFPFLPFFSHISPHLPHSPALQIALIHTFFNIIISLLFLPVLNPFERMIRKYISRNVQKNEPYQMEFITDSVIDLPTLALAQATKEIGRMAELVSRMAENSLELIKHYTYNQKESISEQDNEVDYLHEHAIIFLTKISREELDDENAARALQLIMVTTDLEHIGDSISKTIIKLAEKIETSPLPLSSEGRNEIITFYHRTITDLKEVLAAFTLNDLRLAEDIHNRKNSRDELYTSLFSRHMERLFNRKPESLETTSIHSDLLEEIRRIDHFVFRISAHLLNIHNAE